MLHPITRQAPAPEAPARPPAQPDSASRTPGRADVPVARGSALPDAPARPSPPPAAAESSPTRAEPRAGGARFARDIAFLEEEIKSLPPDAGRRAALLHLEVARVLESSGAPPSKVEERATAATTACPDLAPAHRLRRRFLRRRKQWDELLATIDAELAATPEPKGRAALHVERGRVLRDFLKRPAEAAADFERALALVPDDASAAEALRVHHAAGKDWAAAARALESAAAAASPARALDLRRDAALLRDHALGEDGPAAALWELVLEDSPGDAVALAAVERLFARGDRPVDMCRTLVRRAETAEDPDAAFDAWLRAGTIAAERLGDREHAVEWLEAAARSRPERPEPLDTLADVHRRAGDFDAWQAALARRAALAAHPAERAELLFRRAAILADRLERRVEAIPLLQQALVADATHVGVVRLLSRLLEAEGRAVDRVELELLAAERIADPAERAAALVRVGEWCERDAEGWDRAADAYARALAARPGDRAAFDALRRLRERAGAWKEVADLLARRVQATPDDAEKRVLLRRLAFVQEDRLDEPGAAAETLERLRKLEPDDPAVLWDLQRLHARAGRFRDLALALGAEADLVDDPERRADLLWRAGVVIEERLGDEGAARKAYVTAVEGVAGHRPSVEALARLAGRKGRWKEHLELSDRAMESLPPAERAERLVRTAAVAADALGDADDAVDRCRRALELAPANRAALDALRLLHERRRDRPELAAVLGKLAELEAEPIRRAALRVRLGDLLLDHLDSSDEAVAAYGKALLDAPGHAGALEGLVRAALRRDDWEGLREAVRSAGAAARTPRERVGRLRVLAVVLAWRLARTRDALGVLDEILGIVEDDPWALRQAVMLHLREGKWKEAAETLARLAGTGDEPAQAAARVKEEASIRETHLRQDPAERLAAALTLKPDDLETLGLCEQLAPGAASLIPVLSRRLAVTTDPVERALLRLRLASATEEAGDDTAWFGMLEQAVREVPDFLPVVRLARQAAEAREDWPVVVKLLESEGRPEVTARPAARLEALRRAAELAAEKLRDPGRARTLLARAFDLDPADRATARALADRLRAENESSALGVVLGRHAEALPPGERSAVLFELAVLQRDALESPADAASTLETLLSVDAGHAEGRLALADLQYAAGAWQAAAGNYRLAEEAWGRATPQWRSARLRRIDVVAGRLSLYDEAETLVRNALGDGDDRELLGLLLRVVRARGDNAAAEAVVEWLARGGTPAETVGYLAEYARIALARGDLPGALDRFDRAAEASLAAPEAFAAVRDVAAGLPPGEVVRRLKDLLYRSPAARGVQSGPMRLFVTECMAAQGKVVEAESEIRSAVELLPNDVNAWILLSQASGDMDEVRRALTEALRLDPLRREVHQGLVRLGERDGRMADIRRRAAAVLAAFGDTDDTVRMLAQPVRPPKGDRKLAREQLLTWVVHPAEPRDALELLFLAGPKLGSIYPQPDFGTLETIPRGTPVGQEVDAAASLFGVEKVDASYTQRGGVVVAFQLDERPRVVLGSSAGILPPPVLRFHLGRVFALLASGGTLAALLPAAEIRRLVDGLAGLQVEGHGEPSMVQRVGKVIGWMARRALSGAAREHAGRPADMTTWSHRAACTANRGGLLACADFGAARAALHAMAGVALPPPGAPDAWRIAHQVPGLDDLAAWYVGAEYGAARSAVG
jgi:tetratricopeptide (TPR) repeat protein